jgi:predicted GIY-YIG superfamily endonuclease
MFYLYVIAFPNNKEYVGMTDDIRDEGSSSTGKMRAAAARSRFTAPSGILAAKRHSP